MTTAHNHALRRAPHGTTESGHPAELIGRYDAQALHRWCQARHRQSLLAPTAIGTVADSHGHIISIALGINGETIVETDFDAEGGVASGIAAATAAHLAHGLSLEEARAIDENTVLAAIGTFPAEERRLAMLAATAVRRAVHCWTGQGAVADRGARRLD